LRAALLEIKRLETLYHQAMIGRVIDLEIAMGISAEKDRESATSRMSDPCKYPEASLEHLRKDLLLALTQIHRPTEKAAEDQAPRGYIQ
jgi:prefoldin subunit 5